MAADVVSQDSGAGDGQGPPMPLSCSIPSTALPTMIGSLTLPSSNFSPVLEIFNTSPT
jgi:hypothetical protein